LTWSPITGYPFTVSLAKEMEAPFVNNMDFSI
jgi:hypothetical protein